MGNDDASTFDAVAHLKIIDVSCPQQMLSIMKWIMDGNRGLVYLRVMRTGSAVLYDSDYAFEFGKGYEVRRSASDRAIVISSGRGVHEALAAAELCAKNGINIGVVDMPSVDDELMIRLYRTGLPILFAEQNNGYLWQNFLKVLYRHRADTDASGLKRVSTLNTLDRQGNKQFIHSATYEELVKVFGLTPDGIAQAVQGILAN
jgi:transketolase C-terminal domain/subunit